MAQACRVSYSRDRPENQKFTILSQNKTVKKGWGCTCSRKLVYCAWVLVSIPCVAENKINMIDFSVAIKRFQLWVVYLLEMWESPPCLIFPVRSGLKMCQGLSSFISPQGQCASGNTIMAQHRSGKACWSHSLRVSRTIGATRNLVRNANSHVDPKLRKA